MSEQRAKGHVVCAVKILNEEKPEPRDQAIIFATVAQAEATLEVVDRINIGIRLRHGRASHCRRQTGRQPARPGSRSSRRVGGRGNLLVSDGWRPASGAAAAYAVHMSEPAPELDAEDALRGVVNQLVINGERMPVIIPGSVIEALRVFATMLTNAQVAGYLPPLLLEAMPWAQSLRAEDLETLASDLAEAAASGERAPERLAALMREWRETAEILADPEAVAELAAAEEADARGDVIRGKDAVRDLRPQR